jgi:RNAse (barnase) inhibitor barstar
MAEVLLDGSLMKKQSDFYDLFFAAVKGLMPDYGGRNLNAVVDDLRELSEPMTIRWVKSKEAATHLGESFDPICSALRTEQANHPVTLILE